MCCNSAHLFAPVLGNYLHCEGTRHSSYTTRALKPNNANTNQNNTHNNQLNQHY